MPRKKSSLVTSKKTQSSPDHTKNNTKKAEGIHPDHSADLHRISRIAGQLSGIRKMIENRQYCPDILVQTKAVRSALLALEQSILEKHLNHCVHSAFHSKDPHIIEQKIQELLDIFKKKNAQE